MHDRQQRGDHMGRAGSNGSSGLDQLVRPMGEIEVPTDPVPSVLPREPMAKLDQWAQLHTVIRTAYEQDYLHPSHGGVLAEIVWLTAILDELEELEALSLSVVYGDAPSVTTLRERLRDAPRWSSADSRSLPNPMPEGPTACPLFRPINPYSLVGAGLILDRLDGEGRDQRWLEQAIGFALSRTARLQGVLNAAAQVDSGAMSLAAFAAVFRALKPPQSSHDTPHGDALHGDGPDSSEARPSSHEHSGMPTGLSALLGLSVEPPEWDPCTLAWGRCAGLIGERGGQVIDAGDVPVLVDRAEPEAVCHGYTGTLTLYPRSGEQFPTAEPQPAPGEGLVMQIGGSTFPLNVTPSGWTATSITVDFPAAATPGCATIDWRPPSRSLGERLDSDDCDNLLGIRPIPLPLDHIPGRYRAVALSIVGTPALTFHANGQAMLSAEACSEVRLTWDVETGLCVGLSTLGRPQDGQPSPPQLRGGFADVTLSANNQVVLANAPLNGEMVVTAANTTTYTLAVESYAGTTLCGSATASVTVTRTGYISLSAPDKVFHPSRQIPVTVEVSCSAPTGGLQVALTSSDPAALPDAVVTILANATKATVDLGPSSVSSRALQVTATAPGYSSAAITLLINPTSCVPPSFHPQPERYGGTWTTPVAIPGVVGVHLAVLHTGEVLLFNYDEGLGARGPFASVMRCLTQIVATLAACDNALAASQASCEAAHVARMNACNSTFNCSTSAACEGIQCTSFANCASWNVPCQLARAACVAAAAAGRLACHTARVVCEGLRAACRGTSEAMRIACRASVWLMMIACKAAAIGAAAVCAGLNLVVDTLTGTIFLGGIPPSEETASTIANSSRARCALWNPKTNKVTPVALNRNLFCSGHAFLADGRLLVAGGQFPVPGLDGSPQNGTPLGWGAAHDLHLFDPTSKTWTRIKPDMAEGRWYPTVLTLADGKVLVMSGNDAIFAGPNGTQDSLQVFDPLAASSPPAPDRRTTEPFFPRFIHPVTMQPVPEHIYHLYPFAHLLPSGEVFIHWKRRTVTCAPNSTGTVWTTNRASWRGHWAGPLLARFPTWKVTQWPVSRTGPGPGTSVLLPLIPTRDPVTGDVTYPVGRIMIIGGGGAEGEPDPKIATEEPYTLTSATPATNTVEILDYSQRDVWGTPNWRYTAPMANPRVMPDAVLLPDGQLLVVNGARVGRSGGFMIHFGEAWGASQPVRVPELFDPEQEMWEELCPKPLDRLYHATAALLPDGRVVVAGHDGYLNQPVGGPSEYRLEVFEPPYLHRGARPVIRKAPSVIVYGSQFSLDTDDAQDIESVALLRQSSITHQTNTDQRYVRLWIGSISDANKTIWVTAPPHGGVAPPGYYMLFIVNRSGVPSEASWVRVA
jgi:hypothetical protein